MRAPAAGRSAAESLLKPLSDSVNCPLLPKNFALQFSSATGSLHAANSARADATMCSSLSMAEEGMRINRDKKREAPTASLFRVRLSDQRGFGLLRDLSESRSVVNGQISPHLSVDVDRCFFQAV